MKVIFLDVDGVLVTHRSVAACEDHQKINHFDAGCVSNLRRLIVTTGAKVVISSTWRRFHCSTLTAAFKKFNLPSHIGITPFLDGKQRGYEIDAWLKEHPEVTDYVILDDDSDMLAHQKGRLIKTSMAHGLTDQLTNLAIEQLL
jgi:hypothetical protein